MRVRVYGRTAMTFGVLAAILAAVPFGVAVPSWGGVGFLGAGARAEEGNGDATTGEPSGGEPADVDGSAGSGGASAGAAAESSAGSSAESSAGSSAESSAESSAGQSAGAASTSAGEAAGGSGNEGSAAGAAADDGRGDDQGDRGGAAVSGAPAGNAAADRSVTSSPAGSVEAGAPGRSAVDADGSRGGSDAGAGSAAGGTSSRAATTRGASTSTSTGTGAGRSTATSAAPAGAATGTAAGTAAGTGGSGTAGLSREGTAGVGKSEAGAGETTGRARGKRETPAPDSGIAGGAPRANGTRGAASSGNAPPVKAVRVERDAEGVGVVYSNQVRERISGGRLEMKDAGGRTVVDRPATAKDIERVRENVRRSGLGAAKDTSLPAGSEVESVAVSQDGMAVRYREGWTENLAGDRYRFSDPDGNTVVDRPATAEDRSRLLAIAGG